MQVVTILLLGRARGKKMYSYRKSVNFATSPDDEIYDRTMAKLKEWGIDKPSSFDIVDAQKQVLREDPDLAERAHDFMPGNPLLSREGDADDVDGQIAAMAHRIARQSGLSFSRAVQEVMREEPDLARRHRARYSR